VIGKTLALVILLSSWSASAIKPSWRYQVLRTPHFEIIYREDQKPLARRYALASEQAYDLLLPIFKEAPEKTYVILRDDTDDANGATNFLPYPNITLYPVLPAANESIANYGDWPLELMLHEYAHVLNIYPAHGFYRPLKYILGSIVRPNGVLPSWYLEGLAVDLESRLSDHGRLRAPETAAMARAFTLDGNIEQEDIARIGDGGLNIWPYGGRPYAYGGWWWDYAHRLKGADVISTWNQNFSRRLPFFLNGPIREQTTHGAPELFDLTKRSVAAHAEKEIETLRTAPISNGGDIEPANSIQEIFAVSPSGRRLAYVSQLFYRGGELRVKTRASSGQPWKDIRGERVLKLTDGLRIHWINDDEFVFDQVDLTNPWVNYRDLYVYDMSKRKLTRLTFEARAQEPAPSPDGSTIAFIQNDGGRTKLSILDRQSGKIKTLVNGTLNHRLGSPEYLNSDELLFTLRQITGKQQIYSFNFKSKSVQPWNRTLFSAESLKLTKQGLLALDSGTRARNVYKVTPKSHEALSNTLTDIVHADYDPEAGALVVSEMTGQGRKLKTYPFAVYQPPRLPAADLPPPPKSQVTSVKTEEESFQPISYLWPRYWFPFIYQADAGYIFQATSSINDPIGRNAYSLLASYDTISKRMSYGFDYVNHSFVVDINPSFAHAQSYLGASGYTVTSDTAALTFASHWPMNSRFQTWRLGGLYAKSESAITTKRIGPAVDYQFSNLGSSTRQWFSWQAELSHQQFLEQTGYLAYGRSYASLGGLAELGGNHRLHFETRAAVAPDLPFGYILDLGDRSLGGIYTVNLVNSNFLLRGYPSGEFTGRKITNANLEYLFPIQTIGQGYGTFPLFFQDVDLVLFTDALSVDGAAYDGKARLYRRRRLSQYSVGSGGEVRLNTMAGYHLPVNFTVGIYYGADTRFGGGFSTFISMGFGELGPIKDKRR
jgi:hypothetical protein